MVPSVRNTISAETLKGYCDDGAQESSVLEFKRCLPARDEEAKLEFAKDVSAFANADGGFIIFGICEADNVASKLCPIVGETPDKQERRLRQILQTRVEPRLANLEFWSVDLDGGYALVLRVAASLDGPHWTQHHDARHFYVRRGTLIATMTYDEVRNGFGRTATLTEQARRFRQERLRMFEAAPERGGDELLPLCAIHVLPVASMSGRVRVDIGKAHKDKIATLWPHFGGGFASFNLDGVFISPSANPPGGQHDAFVQLFRNGALEAVGIIAAKHVSNAIPSGTVTTFVRSAINALLDGVASMGIEGPVLVGLSILHIGNYQLAYDLARPQLNGTDRTALVIPEQLINGVVFGEERESLCIEILDVLWQSFNQPRCPGYDENGRWVGFQ